MFSNNSDKTIDGKNYCYITGSPGVRIYAPCGNGTGAGGANSLANIAPTYSASNIPNLYAPVSEVNRPIRSTPVAYNTSNLVQSSVYNPSSPYVDGLYNSTPESRMNYYIREKKAEEEAKRQQEALITANINKQLDRAASEQYGIMDKLYIQGGLDEMRKEYYRLCGGTEGSNSVYARAAYNSLCAKDKEETINTPAVTKGANEYYVTGGMASLKHLVNSYKDSNDFVNYNIAKRILK